MNPKYENGRLFDSKNIQVQVTKILSAAHKNACSTRKRTYSTYLSICKTKNLSGTDSKLWRLLLHRLILMLYESWKVTNFSPMNAFFGHPIWRSRSCDTCCAKPSWFTSDMKSPNHFFCLFDPRRLQDISSHYGTSNEGKLHSGK